MTKRERIFHKFDGRCAYSGTPLEDDWQIDHVAPIIRRPGVPGGIFFSDNAEENMVPVQKIINHYKSAYDLELFRNWLLGELHLRLRKLPRQPRTEKSIKHKAYLLKVANYFEISQERPFSKVFYFETLQSKKLPHHEQTHEEVW